MSRATKHQMYDLQDKINLALSEHGYFNSIFMEHAYGKPRVYLLDENKNMVDPLSPRLPLGQMILWLEAYYTGLNMGLMRMAEEKEDSDERAS